MPAMRPRATMPVASAASRIQLFDRLIGSSARARWPGSMPPPSSRPRIVRGRSRLVGVGLFVRGVRHGDAFVRMVGLL